MVEAYLDFPQKLHILPESSASLSLIALSAIQIGNTIEFYSTLLHLRLFQVLDVTSQMSGFEYSFNLYLLKDTAQQNMILVSNPAGEPKVEKINILPRHEIFCRLLLCKEMK